MSNLREAAQQALEALENCSSDYGHRCNRCDSEVDEGGKVASALRAALAQPAAPTPYTEADCLAAEKKWSAPAAPTVVEPVAWFWVDRIGEYGVRQVSFIKPRNNDQVTPLYPPRAALSDEARALIEECRAALVEELTAWDIDPPLHHIKQAHDKCVAWLSGRPRNE